MPTTQDSSRPDPSKQLLVVSILAPDQPGLLQHITRTVKDCGCNIAESRMTLLAGEFTMLLLIAGNWNMLTRLENQLPKLESQLGLRLCLRRSTASLPPQERLPYAIDAVCVDQPGIIFNLASFFTERGIGIHDLTTRGYPAVHTGTSMVSVQMTVDIPADLHLGTLRDDFTDFCDQLNLDAVLEPIKS
ncbi:MAG: glycine cleavage system protein R [Gammaproteobacteria bacterium]